MSNSMYDRDEVSTQGLEIQPDGEIYGRMKDRVFTIDQGTTTFTGNDSSATSFDTEYYFTVTATDYIRKCVWIHTRR